MRYLLVMMLGCTGQIDSTSMPDGQPVDGNQSSDAPVSGGAATLTITATSTTGGGQYAPRNVVALWIEGPGGVFVKTVDRWAGVRKQHLVAWTTAAGGADADAVSGATRANHATPLTLTWNMMNRQNQLIPDGTYTVRMESTELNANTAGQNHQGTFTFVKGPAPQQQTGLSNGGFTNVTLKFVP